MCQMHHFVHAHVHMTQFHFQYLVLHHIITKNDRMPHSRYFLLFCRSMSNLASTRSIASCSWRNSCAFSGSTGPG